MAEAARRASDLYRMVALVRVDPDRAGDSARVRTVAPASDPSPASLRLRQRAPAPVSLDYASAPGSGGLSRLHGISQADRARGEAALTRAHDAACELIQLACNAFRASFVKSL